jgi:hypothetical protein
VALLLLLILASFGKTASGPAAPPETPTLVSDATLYRHIIRRMELGESYYTAAAQEQRYHGFPLKPIVTVRLPSMSWLNLSSDPQLILRALLVLTAVAWAALPGLALGERTAVAVLITAGAWQVFADDAALIHEYWAALLIALSAAVYRPHRWWVALLSALAAVLIRELALPFLLLAGAFAFAEGRCREAAGWAAATLIFGMAMVVHGFQVSQVALPTDRVSSGWLGLLGYPEVIRRIAMLTPIAVFPDPVAKVIASVALVGWLGLRDRRGVFVFLFLIGMTIFLAVFPRYNNLFWTLMVAPLWLAGLTFLPRLGIWLLRGGVYGERNPSSNVHVGSKADMD